jgi:glycosyltransferase involved in cell wall biosynthesis
MEKLLRLTVVIPCFNEGESLRILLINAERIANDYPICFVFVDNGSNDQTAHILSTSIHRNIKFLHLKVNQGYGAGIKAGLDLAETDYVGWTHADLQTPLMDLVNSLDFCINDNNFIKGKRIGRKLGDKIFSSGMGYFESLIFGKRLFEINAQPTIFHKSLMNGWNPPKDFSLDLYAYILAKKMHWNEVRFDVKYNPRIYGNSKWNIGARSKIKFISRTIVYSLKLRWTNKC